jgi:hypothetical protein
MRPAEWYAQGIRILARTMLEAVRDALGNLIGAVVARVRLAQTAVIRGRRANLVEVNLDGSPDCASPEIRVSGRAL